LNIQNEMLVFVVVGGVDLVGGGVGIYYPVLSPKWLDVQNVNV
jgi:hypothetical protein